MNQQTSDAERVTVTPGLSDAELRAVAYFAIGVGSEGSVASKDASNRLSFAGNIVDDTMRPVGNSGLSIGTLQTDLGQHTEVASSLVEAYQTWARTSHQDWVLSEQQAAQTVRDLSRDGNAIRADSGRTLDPMIKSHIDTFLRSDAGITYVHSNDVTQANKLMEDVFEPLRETTLYSSLESDDQVRLVTIVAKAYNQSERWGGRILGRIEANQYQDVDGVSDAVGALIAGDGDYMQTGRDAALQGAEVLIQLRNSDMRSPVHSAWESVLADPLVNPTTLGEDAARPDLSSQYAAVKTLFLRKTEAPDFIEAMDRGGTYGHIVVDSRGRNRPQSTNLFGAGDDFAVFDGDGKGQIYVGGVWSEMTKADLVRTANPDRTVDLAIRRENGQEPLFQIDPSAPLLRAAPVPAQPDIQREQLPPSPEREGVEPRPLRPDQRQGAIPSVSDHLQDFRHPEHPRHARYQDTLDKVHAMEAKAGIASGPHSEQMAASLLEQMEVQRFEATPGWPAERFTRLARVELRGETVVAIEHKQALMDDAKPREIQVASRQALSRSVEAVSADWSRQKMPHLHQPQAPVAETATALDPRSLPAHDWRHPDHARHGLYQDLRGKSADAYAQANVGISDAQLERTTAAVAVDMQRQGVTQANRVYLMADPQGMVGPGSGIGVRQGRADLGQPFSQTPPQAVAQAPVPDQSYQLAAQIAVQQAYEQQAYEQQRAQTPPHQPGPGAGPGGMPPVMG